MRWRRCGSLALAGALCTMLANEARAAETIGVYLVARQTDSSSPASLYKDSLSDLAPGDLLGANAEHPGNAATALLRRDEAMRTTLEAFWAERDELLEQRDSRFRALKKEHGKFKNWPPSLVAEHEERNLAIARAAHRAHLAVNSQAEIDHSEAIVHKYLETGDYVGRGKVESPITLVATPAQAHWVLEVMGRYRLFPDGPAILCIKVSPGERIDAPRLASLGLTWSRAEPHYLKVVHPLTLEEPYWEVETTEGYTTSYWKEAASAAVKTFDAFLTGNREALATAEVP